MTLTSTVNKVSYSGDGSTTAFSVTFVFWDADDLRVILRDANGTETIWTRGTQYTVSGGSGATGTVTVSTSPTDYTPASGETLVIKSNLDDKQNTSLPAGGAFPSSSVEQELDQIVRRIQQKDEELGRALKFSETSTDSDVNFPDVTGNASKLIRVNADADGLEAVTLASIDSTALTTPVVVADGGTGGTTAAAARTNLGLVLGTDIAGLATANVFTKTQTWNRGSDVASAGALSLGDGNWFDVTGTTTITSIGTKGVGTLVGLQFDGALTLTHHATDLVLPTGANITTAAGDIALFEEYASGDWRCIAYLRASGKPLTETLQHATGTAVSTSSGTTKDFSSLPAGIFKLTAHWMAVSANGTDHILLQIGDASGGLATAGYNSASGSQSSTSGFIGALGNASNSFDGSLELTLADPATNEWVGQFGARAGSAGVGGGGAVTLSGAIDRVRFLLSGSDSFDGGSVNIDYWYTQ